MDMLNTFDIVISIIGILFAIGLLCEAYRLLKSAINTKQCHMH